MIPELLAPAGNLEKLKVVVSYGADAVYLGGKNQFGLRAASENFTEEELLEAVHLCHQNNVKVYVVLNSFFHNKEIHQLPLYLDFLESIKVDAVIVSDLGVVELINSHCSIPIHLSTQSSCLNSYSAQFWKSRGVERIVLGREVSLDEAQKIREQTDIELEMFVHGSMCMAYSGNCVISNYTSGRDSNRGGCAHSCRFEYELEDNGKKVTDTFMSSKDLFGLRLLKQYQKAGIASLKIEGRNKGPLYAGTITKVYSDALKVIKKGEELTEKLIEQWEDELKKVSHRDYTEASLVQKASNDSIYHQREESNREYDVVGLVADVVENEFIVIEVRKKFQKGETLEVLPFNGPIHELMASQLLLMDSQEIEFTNPGGLVKVPYIPNIAVNNIVRKRANI
ncbi:MAG: peptidase U32 family protein [Bacteriovoracaceae bacterium]